MKYLSLAAVRQRIPTISFPISELEKVQLLHELTQFFPEYSTDDFYHFIQGQQQQSTQVFTGWIESDSFLRDTLISGKITGAWKDVNKISNHAIFNAFRDFITPYLYPILKEGIKQINTSVACYLISYSSLLNDTQQNVIQDVLSDWYNQRAKLAVTNCNALKSDSLIHQHLHGQIDEAFLDGLNRLNDRHYGVRMEVMEHLFSLLYHKNSSKRLAVYILGLAKSLKLSKEHQEQIKELEADLKRGKVSLEKSKIPWLRLAVVVILILVLGAGVIFTFFLEANPQEYAYQEETSFMQFSEKDRHKLDSLIGDIQSEQRNMRGNPRLDENVPFIGQQLVNKRDWINAIYKKMERSWAGNDTVVLTKTLSTSKAYSKPYPGTKSVGLLDGKIPSELHNNSDQTLLLVVFENTKTAPVYSKYIHAKSEYSFECNPGEIVIVVPGSKVSGSMHFGDLPFKEVNYAFYENLSNAYRVKMDNSQKITLVWETMGTDSYLMDVSNSLENF